MPQPGVARWTDLTTDTQLHPGTVSFMAQGRCCDCGYRRIPLPLGKTSREGTGEVFMALVIVKFDLSLPPQGRRRGS